MKTIAKKWFTLIELMIVMAIIAVLATTLVPQLIWAQARSRDAGRVATLKNFSAVLETYLSDEWYYPRSPSNTSDISATGDGCFSDTNWTVNPQLAEMLKWNKAQLNPQRQARSWPCTAAWAYGYVSLTKDWISDNGYMLVADVETYKKANADYDEFWTVLLDGAFPYETISQRTITKLTSETTPASNSVYIETN